MILKFADEPRLADSCENAFVAVDERTGRSIGSCEILIHENTMLFPARPVRVYIDIEGTPAPDALIGAAVARAKEVARASRRPARVFTSVMPDDTELLNVLAALGMRDNDGLIVMKKEVPAKADIPGAMIPKGCVLIRDRLDDDLEKKFFLERYNSFNSENRDMDWLESVIAKEGFCRLLVVSKQGMAGELVCWQEEGHGVIGWFDVSSRWREMGIATALIDLALSTFAEAGVETVECTIRVRIPLVLRFLSKLGFEQDRLLCRYPGADVDPDSKPATRPVESDIPGTN